MSRSNRPSMVLTPERLKDDYITNRMSMHAIARKYQCSSSMVHHYIVLAGIKRRKEGRPTVLTPANRERIIAMRKSRYSILWIAAALGINKNVVWNVIKAEGLTWPQNRRAA